MRTSAGLLRPFVNIVKALRLAAADVFSLVTEVSTLSYRRLSRTAHTRCITTAT